MATENEPTLQSLAEGQQSLAEGQQRLAESQQHLAEGQQRLAESQQRLASLLTDFIEEQRKVNEEQRKVNQAQLEINARVEGRLNALHNDVAEIKGRLNTLHNDMAEIKGGHARTETFRRADLVAEGLNFTYERALSASELGDMVRENPEISSSFRGNELESFTKADLVIKAKDRERLTNYLAVEISYTADQRDIDRARRNADLLTRFTGRPAHPVVASVRNDSVVSNLVSIGYVNWYQIPLRDLQAV